MNFHRIAAIPQPRAELVRVETELSEEVAAELDRLPGVSRAEKLRRAVLALLVAESHLAGG